MATDVTNYVNSLYSVGCNICIDQPTRVAKKSATCIDHIYSNLMQDKLVSHILMSDVSDHYSTLTKIGDFSKSNKKTDIYFRKSTLSKKLWDKFNFELGNILNENFPLGSDCDVNHQANIISKAYKILVDKYIPLKKLSKKRQKREDKPWMTAGLKTSRKKSLHF